MFQFRHSRRLVALVLLPLYLVGCNTTSSGSLTPITPATSQALRSVDIVVLKEAQPSAGAPRSYGGGGSSGYTHYPSSNGNSGAALAGAAIGLGIIGIIVVAQAIKR